MLESGLKRDCQQSLDRLEEQYRDPKWHAQNADPKSGQHLYEQEKAALSRSIATEGERKRENEEEWAQAREVVKRVLEDVLRRREERIRLHGYE